MSASIISPRLISSIAPPGSTRRRVRSLPPIITSPASHPNDWTFSRPEWIMSTCAAGVYPSSVQNQERTRRLCAGSL